MIKGFQGTYRFLSNFYHAPIIVSGIPYLNSEAAFQAGKSLDTSTREQFSSLSPKEAKALGRKIQLRNDWNVCKVEIMELCLRAKFMTHEHLAEKLRNTGDQQLIEYNTWVTPFGV